MIKKISDGLLADDEILIGKMFTFKYSHLAGAQDIDSR